MGFFELLIWLEKVFKDDWEFGLLFLFVLDEKEFKELLMLMFEFVELLYKLLLDELLLFLLLWEVMLIFCVVYIVVI